MTLCIIHKNNQVLLGMKKRGFGTGKWNGFGGKLEKGETLEGGARREVFEESGITVINMKKKGILDFTFMETGEKLQVHIFHTTKFMGKPIETEEMRPKWFSIDNIPYDHMWSDDIYWLPKLLAGERFTGKFSFDSKNQIIEKELIIS